MALRMSLDLRLEWRAPSPLNAVCGIEGLKVADQVLKNYNAVGILIGGLAKEIWKGTTSPRIFAEHKDVDVLVPIQECNKHPRQWENGVDWWISHKTTERPTNGTNTGLIFNFVLKPKAEIKSGLHFCPLGLLKELIKWEKQKYGNSFRMESYKFITFPRYSEFPVLPEDFLDITLSDENKIALHCKPQ